MTDREQFEQWAEGSTLPVQKDEFDRYDCERPCAWAAWQKSGRLHEIAAYRKMAEHFTGPDGQKYEAAEYCEAKIKELEAGK